MEKLNKSKTCDCVIPQPNCFSGTCIRCNKPFVSQKYSDDSKPIHEGIAISSQEILDNRCNAYEFIDFNSKETLEEAIVKGFIKTSKEIDYTEFDFASFKLGAKWRQEQNKGLYTKEDLESAFVQGALTDLFNTWRISEKDMAKEKFAQWFEQFEKKQEN